MGRKINSLGRIDNDQARSTIKLLNDAARPLHLLIEEELDQYRMCPGDTVEIAQVADADIRLTIFEGGIQVDFVPRPAPCKSASAVAPSIPVHGGRPRAAEMRRAAARR